MSTSPLDTRDRKSLSMFACACMCVEFICPSDSTLRWLAGSAVGLLREATIVLGRDAKLRGPRESVH